MTPWTETFEQPAPEHRACPFWFWNGELDEPELLRQIELMHKQGIGGFVIHPRVGLTVEYLSEKWFRCCKAVIDDAARRGMKVWIYDEENWPSGYAGGRVVRRDASFRGQNLVAHRNFVDTPGPFSLTLERPDEVRAAVAIEVTRAERQPHNPLLLFSSTPGDDWRDPSDFIHHYAPGRPTPLDCTDGIVRWDVPPGKWCILVLRQQPTDWMGCYSQHPYVDLMNPHAVRAFIDETHERYLDHFREHFGTTILGFFIDEPAFYNNFWDRNHDSVPFTHDFADEFLQRRGYDFYPWAAALWLDIGRETENIRVDYWRTVAELFEERCFKQIADWCHKHDVNLTGHLEWEEWIYTTVRHGGSPFHSLRPMQIPAVDKIDEITDKISEKLIASIAHAHKRPRVLSETFALIGWKLAPPYMKRIVDQQYVRGINWLSCHGFYYSTEDWRKFECPPSEFFQNPWWEHSQPLWDYVGRLSAALSSGDHVAPVALYYPVEHAWATMTPDAPPPCDGTVWELWQLPSPDHPTQRADLSMQRTADHLLRAQYDFDFVDHTLLADAAIHDKHLHIGNERFAAIVVPSIDAISSRSMIAILNLADAGGTVIFMNTLPQRTVDGDMPAQWPPLRAALAEHEHPFVLPFGAGWIGYVPRGEYGVRTLLTRCIEPDFAVLESTATRRHVERTHARIHLRETHFRTCAESLRYHCRQVHNGRLYFIFNESPDSYDATLRLRGTGGVVQYDARTGTSMRMASASDDDGCQVLTLDWQPWESRLLCVGETDAPLLPAMSRSSSLSLDHWHIAFDGQRFDGPLASWHELGWPQYSGTANYETTFTLDDINPAARYNIHLGEVFETARLWLNNKQIGDQAWAPYRFDITDAVQPGINRLRVEVANTNTNAFERIERTSGLLGPVSLDVHLQST